MRASKVKVSVLTLAFCLMMACGLCGVVAQAYENYVFTLTVEAANTTDAEYAADVKTAEVVVDIYKVADGQANAEGYDRYDWIWDGSEFASLEEQYESVATNRDSAASDWQAVYETAADLAKNASPVVIGHPITGDAASDIELNGRGLYLVLARGADEEVGSGKAYSARCEYEFPATMVSAPTKLPNEDGVIYTDTNAGPWQDSATIMLKSSRKPLFGSLEINKSVVDYGGEETTFVFHAYDELTGGEIYDEYGAITLNGESTGTTALTHIPAQLKVVVDEVYTGGRYLLASENGQTTTIVSDHDVEKDDQAEVASVSFTNEPSGNNPGGGHGIENHFDYADGDWTFEARPSKPHTSGDKNQE